MIPRFSRVVLITRVRSAAYVALDKALLGGDLQSVIKYLQALQNFAMYISGYNKPTVLEIQGELSNAAAAIFLNIPMINCNRPTKIVFNEVEKSATLLGGSSYTLSRLPRGLGKYLALTGTPLHNADLWHLGLVNMDLDFDNESLRKMEQIFRHLPRFREISMVGSLPELKKLRDKMNRASLDGFEVIDHFDSLTQMDDQNKEVALISAAARHLVAKHANTLEDQKIGTGWEERLKLLESTGMLSTIENRFGTVWKYAIKPVMKQQLNQVPRYKGAPGEVVANVQNMQKFFEGNSFKEVIESLRNDSSEWAKTTLSKISKIDPRLGDLVLKQIDFASENDYVSCLLNEYKVAIEYMAPHAAGGKGFEGIDTTFNPRSPVKALLPVKNYVWNYPDAVRMALNNTHNCDPFVNTNFGETVRTFLNLRGIDILNPVTTMDVARDVLWRREKLEMDAKKHSESQRMLLTNSQAQIKYFKSREQEIEKFFSSPDVNKRINELTAKAFNRKLERQVETQRARAKSAQAFIRRDNLDKLRDTLIKQTITPKLKYDRYLPEYKSPLTFPLEIVNDPSAENPELMEKYKITERAKLYTKKRAFSPAKLKSYLKGSTHVYDLYDIELKEGAEKAEPLVDDHYFRGLDIVDDPSYDAHFIKPYREKLGMTGVEDQREKEFREKYLSDQKKLIMKRSPRLSQSQVDKMISNLRKTLFDYKQGTKNPFAIYEPHTAQKSVPFDSKAPLLHMNYMKTPHITALRNPLKSLSSILDIDPAKSDTLKGPLQSELNKGLSNSIEFHIDQMRIDEFVKQKVFNLIDFEGLTRRKGDSTFSRKTENPIINSMRASFTKLLRSECYKRSKAIVLEQQKRNFQSKKLAGKGRRIKRVEKDVQLVPSSVNLLEQPAQSSIKEGEQRSFPTKNIMGPLDNYLNANMNFDFYEREAPTILGNFSEKIICFFEDLYTKLRKENSKASSEQIGEIRRDLRKSKFWNGLKKDKFKLPTRRFRRIANKRRARLYQYLAAVAQIKNKITAKRSKPSRSTKKSAAPSEDIDQELKSPIDIPLEEGEKAEVKATEANSTAPVDSKKEEPKETAKKEEKPAKEETKQAKEAEVDKKATPAKQSGRLRRKNPKPMLPPLRLPGFPPIKTMSAKQREEYRIVAKNFEKYLEYEAKKRGNSTLFRKYFRTSRVLEGAINFSKATPDDIKEALEFIDKAFVDMINLQDYYQVRVQKKTLIRRTNPVSSRTSKKLTSRYLFKRYARRLKKTKQYITNPVDAGNSKQSPRLSLYVREMLQRMRSKASANIASTSQQTSVVMEMQRLATIQPDPSMSYQTQRTLIKAYRNIQASYAENKRDIAPGPVPLIFELEALNKRLKEGKESGIDDDFSTLKDILKTNIIDEKATPEQWIEQRVTEYFETLFQIREKIESKLSNQELYQFDIGFGKYFSPESVKEMLYGEIERDRSAISLISEIEKAKHAKDADVARYHHKPQLMAFTLKHRILNSVAFRKYRTLFMRIQQLLTSNTIMTPAQRKYLGWEVEIMKVHLERLFTEAQQPKSKFTVTEKNIVRPEYLQEEDIDKDERDSKMIEERMSSNTDFEDSIKSFNVKISQSLRTHPKDLTFNRNVSAEVSKLEERLKIYGF